MKTPPTQLIPMAAFESQPYWERLSPEEQKLVFKESQKLGRCMFRAHTTRLEMGDYLTKLRDILEPKRCFVKHIKNFHMKIRTVYRIIEDYREVRKIVPTSALPVVMAMGYDFARKSYRPIMQRLPAPRSSDPTLVQPWADKVEKEHSRYCRQAKGRQIVTAISPPNPDTLLKEAFRGWRLRFHKLPHDHQVRRGWADTFMGMCLTELGVSGNQSFMPTAIPEEFKRGPGRPSEAEAA